MAFVIVVVFINIQLIIDESLSQGLPNQINEDEYVRNAAICVHGRTPGGNRSVNVY